MYRIYLLLFVLGTHAAKAFEASDEAKYIDLLPEEEKQEFLNRIARRILEEIQSKGTPEESNVEVSDAQLNAHDAYVQGLLKEESANMRSERSKARDEEDLKNEEDNAETLDVKPLEKDKLDQENREVDLTLRANSRQKRKNSGSRKFNANKEMIDVSPFSEIPVEVISDSDDVTNAFTVASVSREPGAVNISSNNADKKESEVITLPNEIVTVTVTETAYNKTNTNDSIEQPDLNIASFNLSKHMELDTHKEIDADLSVNHDKAEKQLVTNVENNQTVIESNSTESLHEIQINNKESDHVNESNEFDTQTKSFLTNEREITISSDNFVTNAVNINEDSQKMVTESNGLLYNTLNDRINDNNDEEDSQSSKFINEDPTTATTNIDYKHAISDVETTNKTETVAIGISKEETMPLMTTTSPPEFNSGSVSFREDNGELANPSVTKAINHNQAVDDINVEHKNVANETASTENDEVVDGDRENKYLRRLEILTEDYSVENKETFKVKIKTPKRKNVNPYYVYEISGEKPPFVQKIDNSKQEQPYYIPTYNYSPDNVHYNPHNRYGPNTDDGLAIGRNAIQDEELHLHDGFILHVPAKNSKINYKGVKEMHNYPSRNQQKKSGINLQVSTSYPDLNIDVRRRNRARYGKRQQNAPRWPDSKEEDHPYYSLHGANMKDHMRAVRQILYQQKKFGFIQSPYAVKTEPRHKRTFGGVNLPPKYRNNFALSAKKTNSNHSNKGIAIDYYFGRINSNEMDDSDDVNMTDAVGSDVEISHTKEVTTRVRNKNVNILSKRKNAKAGTKSNKGCDSCTLNTNTKSDELGDSIKAMLNVLGDLIYRDNIYLVSYNWLLTTVNIQAAIQKLINLTEDVQKGNRVHPLDLGLLKYIAYLYISSSSVKRDLSTNEQKINLNNNNLKNVKDNITEKELDLLMKRIRMLPKSKRKKPGEKIQHPLEMWRTWYITYYMRILDYNRTFQDNSKNLRKFREFLKDLQDGLYDLHNAIKHIATISRYNDQNWYKDLKVIFLKKANRRKLLQVLLHLEASKLFNLIENSAKNGAEEDLVVFNRNNKDIVKESQEEFDYVLRILEELKVLDNY